MKKLASLIAAAAFLAALLTCDMEYITPSAAQAAPGEPAAGGPEEVAAQSGRYLRLVNMPRNTQVKNIYAASAANSASSIAKMDTKNPVQVFRGASSASVYIPLVYNDGSEFTEDGSFFISLTVYIDALTWIYLTRTDNILVAFSEGRGTLDVLSLPESTRSFPDPGAGSGDPDLDDKIADMEQNGHFLLLYHLPSTATAASITAIAVSDGASQIARADTQAEPLLAPDGSFCNAYMPIVSQNGSPFTRTGSFYIAFSVQIDALTSISVPLSRRVLADFIEGKGAVDIEKLIKANPDLVSITPDPETENQISAIIASGGYLRFFNLPRNVSKNSFSAVSVSSASSIAARVSNYDAIAVRKGALASEAFAPLVTSRGESPFTETGSFFASFSVQIDAVTSIIVQPYYASLYDFSQGAADIDVALAPSAPVLPPAIPHCLTITGLPSTLSPPNVQDVSVLSSKGVIAKCADYTKITAVPFNGGAAAIIPLVYDNSSAFNGQDFSDSGSFLVAFSIFPDASTSITVTADNYCLALFSGGSAAVDVSNIPPVPRHCLTITGLPQNTQPLDIASVFVYNQAGAVAQCADYSLIEADTAGTSVTLRIPLAYKDTGLIFNETGPYYVSFDLNADALTRIIITEEDKLAVSFTLGQGTLDAAALPQALPVPYLTITGLPVNTARGNFSEVFVWNIAGKIAKCADYDAVTVTKSDSAATALIPLVYNDNPKAYFRDSGSFAVSMTVNVDINVQIIKTRADALTVTFTDGSGAYNITDDLGYFSGGLKNPADEGAPIIKKGTVFEINYSYVTVPADTPIPAASFESTTPLFVYADKLPAGVEYSYAASPPAWDAAKKGFYLGSKRALFKLLYIRDTADRFVAKIPMADDWKPFGHYALSSLPMSNIGAYKIYALDGASNPPPQSVSFSQGWHVFELAGGGGGGGGGLDGDGTEGNHSGGAGGTAGYIAEAVYIPQALTLTLFAGSGGSGAGWISYGMDQGAGSGGGSGAFAFSPLGYLLSAGGGGGGGGCGHHYSGAPGGAGGSIGSGGAGTRGTDTHYASSNGGNGGGYSGGPANGGNAGYALPVPSALSWITLDWGYGSAGKAAYFDNPDASFWFTTAGANGQGGNGARYSNGGSGGEGGNNRNSARGGGPSGGSGGPPADGPGSAGRQGAAGFLNAFRLDAQ